MIFQNEKTPFSAIRKIRSKSRKIHIFQKGLTHGLGPKMAIFPSVFFLAIQHRKMSLTIFYNEKTPFQAIKKRSTKKSKNCHFFNPWGLTHGFGPKITIFPPFFFKAIQARKMSFTIFQNKKNAFLSQKQEVQKVKKLTFFQRG